MQMQEIEQKNKPQISVKPLLNEPTKSKMAKAALRGMNPREESNTEPSLARTFPADYSSYNGASESRDPIIDEKTANQQEALNARTFTRETPESSLIDLMKQQNENIAKLLSNSSTFSENLSSTDTGYMSETALSGASVQEYNDPLSTEFVRPVLPPPESSMTEAYQNPSVLQGVEYKKLSLSRK